LNLGIAIWEIFHFKQTVTALQSQIATPTKSNAAEPSTSDSVRDNERRDE